MKTYVEVAQDVFSMGDAYLEQKKKKDKMIKKGAAVGTLVALCFAVFGVIKNMPSQNNPSLPPNVTDSSAATEISNSGSMIESSSEHNTQNSLEQNTTRNDEVAETHTDNSTEIESPSTNLSTGIPSYNSTKILEKAIENNAYGWIKYDGVYYIQDDWSSAYGIEIGEDLGDSSEFEGNLDLLNLSGEVFRIDDYNYKDCLLVKTSSRNIIFLPIPNNS